MSLFDRLTANPINGVSCRRTIRHKNNPCDIIIYASNQNFSISDYFPDGVLIKSYKEVDESSVFMIEVELSRSTAIQKIITDCLAGQTVPSLLSQIKVAVNIPNSILSSQLKPLTALRCLELANSLSSVLKYCGIDSHIFHPSLSTEFTRVLTDSNSQNGQIEHEESNEKHTDDVKLLSQFKSFHSVVHIGNHSSVHHNRELHSSLFSTDTSQRPFHLYICPAQVLVGKGFVDSVTGLWNARRDGIARAFRQKYGQDVGDTDIDRLTRAVITFEFLLVNTNGQLKCTGECCNEPTNGNCASSGVFVIYNYTRTRRLLARFQKMVEQGQLPALPAADLIDFGAISDDNSWNLVWCFIDHYLTLKAELFDHISHLYTKSPVDLIQPKLHKICQFLVRLSHVFSVYYNRYFILQNVTTDEARNELFSRIYLIQAIKSTFEDFFSLTGFEKVTIM